MARRRLLVKVSGEHLAGAASHGIDDAIVQALALELKGVLERDVSVGVVLGGGNYGRGRSLRLSGLARAAADEAGMRATVLNGIVLRAALGALGVPVALMAPSLLSGGEVSTFSRLEALACLDSGGIVIAVGGLGIPFVTTDTASVIRALELDCSLVMKGTLHDGVYTSDPALGAPDCEHLARLDWGQFLVEDLQIMDAAAVAVARAHRLPIMVYRAADGMIAALEGTVRRSLIGPGDEQNWLASPRG